MMRASCEKGYIEKTILFIGLVFPIVISQDLTILITQEDILSIIFEVDFPLVSLTNLI